MAVTCGGAAILGSRLGHANVALIWPPAGIGLAATLQLGYRAWAGIALGAVLMSAGASAPLGVLAGMALGNSVEALLGAYMLQRFVGLRNSLERVRDVLGFVVLAGLLIPFIGATTGILSLCLNGIVGLSQSWAVWAEWWLSDAVGIVVMAPPLLTWATWPRVVGRGRRIAEAGALLSMAVILGETAFGRGTGTGPSLAYLLLPVPPLVWSAVRFDQRASATLSLVAAGIAVLGTAQGHGPLMSATVEFRPALLSAYIGAFSVTALLATALAPAGHRAREATG